MSLPWKFYIFPTFVQKYCGLSFTAFGQLQKKYDVFKL